MWLLAPVFFLQLGRPEREEAPRLFLYQFEGRPAFLAGEDFPLDRVRGDGELCVAFQAIHRVCAAPGEAFVPVFI